jgi:hypothetical protein
MHTHTYIQPSLSYHAHTHLRTTITVIPCTHAYVQPSHNHHCHIMHTHAYAQPSLSYHAHTCLRTTITVIPRTHTPTHNHHFHTMHTPCTSIYTHVKHYIAITHMPTAKTSHDCTIGTESGWTFHSLSVLVASLFLLTHHLLASYLLYLLAKKLWLPTTRHLCIIYMT